MPHHHVQHVQNVGPNLFTHNENSMPLCKHGMPEITYGHAIHTSQMIFIKINRLTF